jgi:hypothetical protein
MRYEDTWKYESTAPNTVLISKLDGGEWQASSHAHFIAGPVISEIINANREKWYRYYALLFFCFQKECINSKLAWTEIFMFFN